jgi:hypothetical protein
VRRRASRAALWGASLAVPPLVALPVFGFDGTLGAWPSVLEGEVASLPFYRAGMGLDDPALRAEETLLWASVWLVVLLVPVGAAWLARETRTPLAPVIAFAVAVLTLGAAGDAIPWTEALRPLQLVLLVCVGALLLARARRGDAAEGATAVDAPPTALALSVLALVLLGKMALNVRVGHYGFALAVPAAVVTVTALLRWLPDTLTRHGVRGDVVRGSILGLLVVFCFAHVHATASWMERKTELVGEGIDAFRADVRGAWVEMAVAELQRLEVGSAAVLPEGVLINYLARIPNPTPYINFMPPEEILFGDAAWEAAFRAAPPDAVVIVPKDTGEFGRGPFGFGYGVGLARWVREEYVPVSVLRREGYGFEVRVLLRRDHPT